MHTDNYIIRQCKNCSHRQRFDYPKREIAFGLHNDDPFMCSKCNSTVSHISDEYCSKLDDVIMAEWAVSPDLYLMEQDEELMLANTNYLELIFKYLDDPKTISGKKVILIEALCVLVYDEIKNQKDILLLTNLKEKLIARKRLLIENKEFVMEYLREVVYPFLGH
jgi:hypothetical protein